METTATPKRVSKACDACKIRKVKCCGRERCQQCSHLGLKCVYSASSRRRSQGKRGRIISEYKNKTALPTLTLPPILPAGHEPTIAQTPPSGASIAPSNEQRSAPVSASTGVQYSKAFFLDLVPDYMESVYPVQPVIAEQELRNYIGSMESHTDVRSFIHAFGGCTLNLTRQGNQRTEEVVNTIEDLMDYSINTMTPPHKNFRSSVMRVMQCIFIHNCLMSLQGSDAAFHYMREAISGIQLLRIDNKDAVVNLSPPERSRRQRMYWQGYIQERFIAILDYRHAILSPLDTLPENDPTIPIQVHEGFNQIIKLFRLLDSSFLENWLGSRGGNITSSWIEAKSLELEGDPENNARELASLSTMQRADLAITREWLRTLVWRLAMEKTLLSSRSSKECLSLLFPVRLSQNLRQRVSSMSREDIEVHGSSITQKLFEITDTIADVLIHVPAASLEETAQRIDDFLFIFDFVLQFPVLDQTRRGILLEKLERLKSMFPEVVSTASSPNLPVELHSPSTDPWYCFGQSKLGSDMGHGAAGLQALAPLQDVQQANTEQGITQKDAWNHISRRLSMATSPVI